MNADAAAEARKIMDTQIHRLRTLPYAELVGYLEPVALEVQAPLGTNPLVSLVTDHDAECGSSWRALVKLKRALLTRVGRATPTMPQLDVGTMPNSRAL